MSSESLILLWPRTHPAGRELLETSLSEGSGVRRGDGEEHGRAETLKLV